MNYQALPLGLLTLLLIGCSAEDKDPFRIEAPPAGHAAEFDVPGAVGTTSLAPVSSSAVDPLLLDKSTPVVESAPVVSDAEEKIALADYTEKVYLKWNAALTSFRQKNGRWPASLKELQQAHPELASFQPPRGFVLNLDPKADEIYLTRVPLGPQVTAAAPPPNLPPPLNIP